MVVNKSTFKLMCYSKFWYNNIVYACSTTSDGTNFACDPTARRGYIRRERSVGCRVGNWRAATDDESLVIAANYPLVMAEVLEETPMVLAAASEAVADEVSVLLEEVALTSGGGGSAVALTSAGGGANTNNNQG